MTGPRTSTDCLRLMSWNVQEYTHRKAHHEAVAEVIRASEPDVLAVQELVGPAPLAVESLTALTQATGMACEIAEDVPALAVSPADFHTGLMWRPERVRPAVCGGWRGYGAPYLARALAVALFEIDGCEQPLRVGSYHATPFSPADRKAEAYRVLAAIYRADHHPGAVLGDMNGIGSNETYDHDPYAHWPWFPDRVHQLRPDVPAGHVVADRSADQVLTRPDLGRLTDAAIHLDAPWQATTGHAPADEHPDRRIDRALVTPGTVRALRSYAVGQEPVSDHRRILIDLDPAKLAPHHADPN